MWKAVILLGAQRAAWSLSAEGEVDSVLEADSQTRKPLLRRQDWSEHSSPNGSILAEISVDELQDPAEDRSMKSLERDEFELFMKCANSFSSTHRPSVALTPENLILPRGSWINCGTSPDVVYHSVITGSMPNAAITSDDPLHGSIESLRGDHDTTLMLTDMIKQETFTWCSIDRYTGGHKGSILVASNGLTLGHAAAKAGTVKMGTQEVTKRFGGLKELHQSDEDWVVMCARHCGDSVAENMIMMNGHEIPTEDMTTEGTFADSNGPITVSVNKDDADTDESDKSDFAIAGIWAWDGACLATHELHGVMDELMAYVKGGMPIGIVANAPTRGDSSTHYAPCTGMDCHNATFR
jgi:hypothetical protein